MKINNLEMEDWRVEFSKVVTNDKTKESELIMLFEFFREHMYVTDNEIRKRAWKKFKLKGGTKIT